MFFYFFLLFAYYYLRNSSIVYAIPAIALWSNFWPILSLSRFLNFFFGLKSS